MRRTLNLYYRLLAVQMRGQMQYRLSFIFEMVINGAMLSLYFVSLVLILQRFDNIGGWHLGEVALLYGLAEIAFGLADMIFSGFDAQLFGGRIRRGEFDQLLLRPVDITLQVLGSKFVLRRLGRIIQGGIIFGYALSLIDLHWTLLKVLYLPYIILGMITFFGGLFVVGATITFWTIQSVEVMNIFTYGGQEMVSYPMHIYPQWLQRFFTFVLPAMFINYYPVLYLLDKPDPLALPAITPLLAPLAGLVVLALALQFWRFGLTRYQSTGS